jgi:hypothetical protein
MLTLRKWASALGELVNPPPRHAKGREYTWEQTLLMRAAASTNPAPKDRIRLCEQLRTAVRRLADNSPAPKQPEEQVRRRRTAPTRYTCAVAADAAADPLEWELHAVMSQAEEVRLEGAPVHLRYRERRSPSGFRDAHSFLQQLGDGSQCTFKRRRKPLLQRPQEVMLLASRRVRARTANPLSQRWQNVTADPSVACSQGAYVKVYYGGDAAARLQARARARLPANLCLRGHRRSLMFFVSVSESNSTTHFDETPSVLVCLCGTRTVWLAPPEVKERCGLRSRAGYPHMLSYDPSACKDPGPAWKCIVLRAGQGVFIPKRWWHLVVASEGSVGMSLEVTAA